IISWETVVDPPTGVLYYVASGDKSSWNRWDTTPLTIVFKRTQSDKKAFDLFDELLMDDEEVNDNGYAAEEADDGGVAIRLLPDYLNELSTGEHVLTAVFADGSAQATFALVTEDIPEPMDKTFVVAAFSCDENTLDSVADVSIEPSSHPYENGSAVTVSAPAKNGWAFVGWYPVTKVSYGLVAEYDKSAQLSNQRSYTFTLTEDVSIVAVYRASGNVDATVRIETVNDATYTIACNGEKDPTVWQGSVHVVPIGTRLTVVAQDPGRVEQWLNESDKVIGTGQQELTYTVTSDTTITLMYSVEESTISQVKFISLDDQVMLYHRYSANLDDASQIEIAAPPTRLGYIFKHWVFEGTTQEATQEAILAKIQNPAERYAEIILRPEYEDQISTGSVTVYTQPEGEEPEKAFTKSVALGKMGTVSAPELAGLDFEAWCDKNGEVLGYTNSLKLAVVGDHEAYAHYVSAGTEVRRVPVIAITGFAKVTEKNGVHKIQCHMTRNAPEGYTMVENGILYGMGLGSLTDDTFVYGTDDVLRFVYKGKETNSASYFNKSISSDSTRVYFRAYMVLKKVGSDDLLTYYSSVRWASFDSIA
ncbi:MAG: InlB B-repeat-containing protein, partial [Atopobiaceae bacterium]|nr:InlB B-repeat-containing protein [Atopobiaceae bacterium]